VDHLTVSFFLTRRCTSRCRHCGAWYTKSADRDFTRDGLARFIADVAGTPGIQAVGLSGGEVFVVKDVFDFAVDEARRLGLPFTFVTNASWAKTEAVARGRLSRYVGTLGMGLSADSFHQEFIPVDRVVNAARAAEALGIPYVVRATMRTSDNREEIEKGLVAAGLPDPAKVAYAPVMFIGQAREKIDPADFPDENPHAPCLSLRMPFIFPNGDVYACCGEAANIEGGHPLFLGNLNETRLSELVRKYETDPTLSAIYTVGPRTLWEKTEKTGRRPESLRDELLLRSPCGTCRLLFEPADTPKG
jgi:MoaA/NifB/PqqE/SkfB family radical SAM enzyme